MNRNCMITAGILIVLYTIVVVAGVSAQDLSIMVHPVDPSVESVVCGTSEGVWHELGIGIPFTLEDFNPEEDRFMCRQYSSIYGISPAYSYRYDQSSKTWILEETPETGYVIALDADRYYRYRNVHDDPKQWNELEKGLSSYSIPWLEEDSQLVFEQSINKEKWNPAGTYRYSPEQNSLLVEKASSPASVEVQFHSLIPEEDLSHMYNHAVGVLLGVSRPFGTLVLSAEVMAHTAESNNVWAQRYYMVSGSAGVGSLISLSDSYTVRPTLSCGFIHHVDEDESFTNLMGRGAVTLMYQVNEQYILTCTGEMNVLIEKDACGYLFGASAGILMRL
ncbi:MAG: hypothetical protein JXK93_08625 [Sphaerochaetaceae bacterium]|nr:hypothetical protein [Sphaerochaetaceae bacterium]